MLPISFLSKLFGFGDSASERNEQDKLERESRRRVEAAAFELEKTRRYYVLSDFHLDPEAPAEHEGLLRFLGRLLSEGGIGGLFLLGDLAIRPGIPFDELAGGHPRLFDTLYRLSLSAPVFLIQGECDLETEWPDYLQVLERYEDEQWIFVHGFQFDRSVELIRTEMDPEFFHVQRGEPDPVSTLEGLRALRQSSGKKIVFGHLHRAGYLEPGLTCVGHWTDGFADYGILREGQLYLSQGRTF